METPFNVIKSVPSGINSNHKVIKASDYQAMYDANGLLEAARKEAEAIVEEGKIQARKSVKIGYERGLAQANQKCAEQLIKTKVQANQMMAAAEEDLVNLVKITVEKLFGEMDDERKIISLVKSGLSSMRSDYQVKVRVAPDMEMTVKGALTDVAKNFPNMEYIEVIADSTLPADSCVLEGDISIVKTSVAEQIAHLDRLIESSLATAE